MPASRAERLLNLHILLLGARRFLSKEAIRQACYGDHPRDAAGDEAFERAFERDKDSLRAIGALIEVGNADAYFDDEVGYRIPTEQSSLPEIRLGADEAAVVGLAAQVWQDATLARATTRALAKLKAQGIDIDPTRLEGVAPAIAAAEPAFEQLWDAVQKRRPVTFDYHRGAAMAVSRRRVQPWGLARMSGRWYVAGHDLDRDATRVFRLSRIAGAVRATGKSGSFDVPPDTDIRGIVRQLGAGATEVRAVLWIRPGAGVALRRRADSKEPESASSPVLTAAAGWDAVVVRGSLDTLADEVLSHGADVLVAAPPRLREDVVRRLSEALTAGAEA